MKRGAILIHGLTGTPANVAPLSEYLSRNGIKVVTPLLAGHGTNISELSGKRWEEWYQSVASAYDEMLGSVDKICCAGISLGGLLTLKLALDKNRPLSRIACIAAPLKLSSVLENFLLPASHLPIVRTFVKMSGKDWKKSVINETGREIYKNSSYHKIPVRSVWELQKLQKEILKDLKNLNTPTMLAYSRHDDVVFPFNVDMLCSEAKKIRPEVLWLENSGHVVTMDNDKELLAEKILSFFVSS